MIRLQRTNSDNQDFQELIIELDEYLKLMDGDNHAFFAQLNKTDSIKHVIVAYKDNEAVGCGAFKPYEEKTMEIKRMFVSPQYRGKGIATLVLTELEKWCKELNYDTCILETGEKQTEAVKLYHKNNYKVIANFGKYADVASSICFEKAL